MPEYSADTPTAFLEAAVLGGEPLAIPWFFGQEGINQLYSYDVCLDLAADTFDPTSLLLEPATLRLDSWSGKGSKLLDRRINGIISEVKVSSDANNKGQWLITLVPAAWRLTQTRVSRIFQKMSAKDVITAVLDEDSQINYAFKLNGSRALEPRDFCVQYNETNFAFILRLLEEEGLFFSIEQEDLDVFVVRDSLAKLPDAAPLAEVPWEPGGIQGSPNLEAVHGVEVRGEARPKQVIVRDFNYDKPSTELKGVSSVEGGLFGDWHMYRDVSFHELSEGDPAAKTVSEGKSGQTYLFNFDASFRSATAGALFAVKQVQVFPPLPFDLDSRSLAIIAVNCSYESNSYQCSIQARPSDLPWSPPRTVSKPRIVGPQTAFVVGASGEEVVTEEVGRIKVQFHWDKVFPGEEGETSCWIRVAQAHAGADHGTYFVPKVGDEVVVAFEEGDPDRPLVIGSVYNADHEFPLDIGDQDQRAILKSSHGFTSYVEDAEGEQKLHVESVSGAHDFVFLSGKEIISEAEDNITVTGHRQITVSGTEDIKINGESPISVSGMDNISIEGTGGGTISISQGAGKITIDSSGNISLEGPMIEIKAQSNLTLQAGGMVTVKGALIKLN